MAKATMRVLDVATVRCVRCRIFTPEADVHRAPDGTMHCVGCWTSSRSSFGSGAGWPREERAERRAAEAAEAFDAAADDELAMAFRGGRFRGLANGPAWEKLGALIERGFPTRTMRVAALATLVMVGMFFVAAWCSQL